MEGDKGLYHVLTRDGEAAWVSQDEARDLLMSEGWDYVKQMTEDEAEKYAVLYEAYGVKPATL